MTVNHSNFDAMEAANVRLPAQSDSSSDEEEESPRKRSRSASPVLVEERCKNDCDSYVRSGTKLKNLAANALAALTQNNTTNKSDLDGEKNESLTLAKASCLDSNSNAAKLAREKTAECLMLEKVR